MKKVDNALAHRVTQISKIVGIEIDIIDFKRRKKLFIICLHQKKEKYCIEISKQIFHAILDFERNQQVLECLFSNQFTKT